MSESETQLISVDPPETANGMAFRAMAAHIVEDMAAGLEARGARPEAFVLVVAATGGDELYGGVRGASATDQPVNEANLLQWAADICAQGAVDAAGAEGERR